MYYCCTFFKISGSVVFLNTLSINGGGPGSVNRTVKKYIKHGNYSAVSKVKMNQMQ